MGDDGLTGRSRSSCGRHRRRPPRLAEIGVDCVTLANNHALDDGAHALLNTLEHLSAVGIACVGSGRVILAAPA